MTSPFPNCGCHFKIDKSKNSMYLLWGTRNDLQIARTAGRNVRSPSSHGLTGRFVVGTSAARRADLINRHSMVVLAHDGKVEKRSFGADCSRGPTSGGRPTTSGRKNSGPGKKRIFYTFIVRVSVSG